MAAMFDLIPLAGAAHMRAASFSWPDGSPVPLSVFTASLKSALIASMGADAAAAYSAHSLRSGAASAMLALGHDDDSICRAFRWESSDTQRGYSRAAVHAEIALVAAMRSAAADCSMLAPVATLFASAIAAEAPGGGDAELDAREDAAPAGDASGSEPAAPDAAATAQPLAPALEPPVRPARSRRAPPGPRAAAAGEPRAKRAARAPRRLS